MTPEVVGTMASLIHDAGVRIVRSIEADSDVVTLLLEGDALPGDDDDDQPPRVIAIIQAESYGSQRINRVTEWVRV
jgi:hypothetical protein